MSATPRKAFIAYSDKDAAQREKLGKCLAVMIGKGEIEIWHDAKILAGDTWEEPIQNTLREADVLIYLVSLSSLSSVDCNNALTDMLYKDANNILVIPILLEYCYFLRHQLLRYEALPTKDTKIKPISDWKDDRKAWQHVAEGIRNALQTSFPSSLSGEIDEQQVRRDLSRAYLFFIIGNYEKAILVYDRVSQLVPNDAAIYNNRGVAYGIKGVYASAVADYRNRSSAYEIKRTYASAMADFGKAIELNPNLAEAYYNRGSVYRDIGNHDAAIADYSNAIKLNPNNAETYINRALVYEEQEDYDKVIADYSKAIALNPNDAAAYTGRGVAYDNKGDYDKAIADYSKAIKLNPNDAMAYINRGDTYGDRGAIYGKKGDFDKAIADYSKAIALNPNNAMAYCNRGVAHSGRSAVYDKTESYDKAIADFNKAIALNPNDADVYYYRGLTYSDRGLDYLEKGDHDSAVADCKKSIVDFSEAIALNPNNVELYFDRVDAKEQLGDYEGARNDLETALRLAKKHGDTKRASAIKEVLGNPPYTQ